MLLMSTGPFNIEPNSTSSIESSNSVDRLRLAIKAKQRVKNSSKDDAYMNLFASKRLTPNPKTLSKVKGWMGDNELNQREAARILCISQTKLSHYLNGRKKIRGWLKLEEKIKEVVNNFDDFEAPSTSSEDEEEFNSRSEPPISDDKEEESSIESSEPSDDDAPDHWSSFSLNEIFNISQQPISFDYLKLAFTLCFVNIPTRDGRSDQRNHIKEMRMIDRDRGRSLTTQQQLAD